MRIFGNNFFPGLNLFAPPAPPALPPLPAGLGAMFGGGAPAPAGDADHPVEDWSKVNRLDQGDQNSCGTTSLAMGLNFLSGTNDYSTGDIDKNVRRMNSFGTAPDDLVEYARDHGFEAGMYNNSSLDEVKEHLRAGHVVQVAIDDPYGDGGSGPFNTKDHYVLVTGFVTGADGKEYVKIRDPNGDDNPNANKWVKGGNGDYLMPVDVFEKKWGRTPDGYNNFMCVYANKGANLPADRLDGVQSSVDIANVYWNTVNDFDRVIHPDNFGSFVHGAIGLVGGAPFIIPTAVGWAVSYVGDNLKDWAKGWPPVLRNIGMAAGDLIGMPGHLLTRLGSAFSETFDDFGGAFENLFNGDVGGFFGGMAEGVGDAVVGVGEAAVGVVKDVGSAIGDALSDIF